MADIPENVDLRFLAEQQARVLAELLEARAERVEMRKQTAEIPELRAEQHALAGLLGKVADAVTEIARTQEHQSKVLAHHSDILEKLLATQQNQGARLNAIDGRLAIIEGHIGLVKA